MSSNKSKDVVSILIPARDEGNNIEKCLLSAINQTYDNLEIIVLDDFSNDDTASKVKDITEKYPHRNIKLLRGKELPDGRNGKSWTCYNLAKESRGDYILFIDADVVLSKYTVEESLSLVKSKLIC